MRSTERINPDLVDIKIFFTKRGPAYAYAQIVTQGLLFKVNIYKHRQNEYSILWPSFKVQQIETKGRQWREVAGPADSMYRQQWEDLILERLELYHRTAKKDITDLPIAKLNPDLPDKEDNWVCTVKH